MYTAGLVAYWGSDGFPTHEATETSRGATIRYRWAVARAKSRISLRLISSSGLSGAGACAGATRGTTIKIAGTIQESHDPTVSRMAPISSPSGPHRAIRGACA